MDTKVIKEIIDIFEGSKVHKLEIEDEEMKIKLEKEENKIICENIQPRQTNFASNVQQELVNEVKEESEQGNWVKSPIVGTFYSKPNENAQSYVSVGDMVKEGDVLCIIEAMKVMNEIKSPFSGKVVKIGKNDGDMVEFDENLICIGD